MGIGMLLLMLSLTAHQAETILIKQYGKKHGQGGMFFNGITCLFAMIYFFIMDTGGLQFNYKIILYGLVSSIMYMVGYYTLYAAFKSGSFGLTKLFLSFNVVITTFYGIVFLHEPATVITYIALFLILFSLFLMNYQKNEEKTQKITLRWAITVLFLTLSNAAIVIIGRMQFGEFGDVYKNEFLILSLGGAALLFFIFGFVFEKDSLKTTCKHGLLYGAGTGFFNAMNNLLILITYNFLAVSFMTPVRTALGIVFSLLISAVLYKEKFSHRQLASAVIGIVAVVLMSL